MCNLGQGIEDRAKERTLIYIVMNMYKNNFSLEQISISTDMSVEEIKKIINEHETAKA